VLTLPGCIRACHWKPINNIWLKHRKKTYNIKNIWERMQSSVFYSDQELTTDYISFALTKLTWAHCPLHHFFSKTMKCSFIVILWQYLMSDIFILILPEEPTLYVSLKQWRQHYLSRTVVMGHRSRISTHFRRNVDSEMLMKVKW
jgi:hypothetical protein